MLLCKCEAKLSKIMFTPKALLFSVGGLFYTVAISALELEKQLHRLSANRLANDQLAKVLNPQKVGR